MQSTTRLPDPIQCKHCGRKLMPRTFELCGRTLFAGWEPCDCEGAELERIANEEERDKLERFAEQHVWEHKLDESGIPPRFRDAEHPWAERLANRVREGRGFYLHGKNGTGKTRLVCATAIILLRLGLDVRFEVATKLLEELRAYSDESKRLLKELADCDVLIIDDLGKEGASTPRAAERLFDLFNDRYNASTFHSPKPIIVTSNFERGNVASAVSEGGVGIAIASRLSEDTEAVPIDGDDRRLTCGQNRSAA